MGWGVSTAVAVVVVGGGTVVEGVVVGAAVDVDVDVVTAVLLVGGVVVVVLGTDVSSSSGGNDVGTSSDEVRVVGVPGTPTQYQTFSSNSCTEISATRFISDTNLSKAHLSARAGVPCRGVPREEGRLREGSEHLDDGLARVSGRDLVPPRALAGRAIRHLRRPGIDRRRLRVPALVVGSEAVVVVRPEAATVAVQHGVPGEKFLAGDLRLVPEQVLAGVSLNDGSARTEA